MHGSHNIATVSTFFLDTPFLPILFLIGSLLLTICNTALIQLGRHKSKNIVRPLFNQDFENLYFSLSLSKLIYQLLYAISFFFFLFSAYPSIRQSLRDPTPDFIPLLLASCLIVSISMLLEFIVRMVALAWSRIALKIAFPPAYFYLALFSPISIPFVKLAKKMVRKLGPEQIAAKTPFREIIRESDLHYHLDLSDQKLISSFINFKERVTKEIMVPRIDLFSLSADTAIREASALFLQEGYSRIPVYKENLDHIIGVVLYKDLLKCYMTPDQNLDAPLETIAKQVLYAPENKKVSQLLQEFRNKQIHMAIVVDEYGGTEGIVTIEDILEELVGEIEDEYDIDEENEFYELPDSGWIIDAKMTLIDIETQIGIHIPTHPEYETLGGYVYHCAGTIPSKGWRLSHDQFDLEVISSNERAIKKIKIIPRKAEEL
jgi:putative hemolysin